MNKLEAGIFFRTKAGTINKIDSFTEDKTEFYFDTKSIFGYGEEYGSKWGYTKDIIKTSHNIIDLIEVGDYVNGSKVSIIESEFIYWETGNAIHCKYIESIVTKEQFKSMEYRL